jgi:hypothetical protein
MPSLRSFVLTLTAYVALTDSGYGAQPPDVVHSDSNANTAMGTDALFSLSSGAGTQNPPSYNTAAGFDALYSNKTGYYNTAVGGSVLYNNTTGSDNTALGFEALSRNTTGFENTAAGAGALFRNTDGTGNAAFGVGSVGSNTTGIDNSALGYGSLASNTTGNYNTALGSEALESNRTGWGNVAVGFQAGSWILTGSNNIEIANAGSAGDNAKIRIGVQGVQNATYIAGISGSHVTGAAVYVTSAGQLGVLASSERYKTAVASMGSGTERLMQLRPVSFHLKSDPKGDVQYGLIAEEVAKVYPELVIRNETGRIEGVRYEELTPLLLNEMQRQQGRLADQARELRELRQQFAELNSVAQRAEAALQRLETTR